MFQLEYSYMEEYLIPCLSKEIFKFPCPGCGGQRAVLHLFKGEFVDAFFSYPAIYPLLILGLLLLNRVLLSSYQNSFLIRMFSYVSVAAILINYVVELNLFFRLI